MEKSFNVADTLLEVGAVKLSPNKPFTWASGWKSPIYCNNSRLLHYPEIRDNIVEGLASLANAFRPEMPVGVSTGAVAWGALVASYLDLPFASVCPEAKDPGMGGKIDGIVPTGSRVVVIEDLVSTGGSSLKVVQTLRDTCAEVLGMVAIFSYLFPQAQQAFTAADCKLQTLCDYSRLVDAAIAQGLFGEPERELLSSWRESPETWESSSF